MSLKLDFSQMSSAAAKKKTTVPKKETHVERPKAKRQGNTVSLGAGVSAFKGWSVQGDCLKYTNLYEDRRSFIAALYAAVEYGRGEILDAKGSNGVCWNSSIGKLPRPDTRLEITTEKCLTQVGLFMVPKVGCIVEAESLDFCLESADALQSANWCGLGVPAIVKGAAAPCGAFQSWHDFMYFYFLNKDNKEYQFYVDTSCASTITPYHSKLRFQDIALANAAVAPPVDVKKKNIIYMASLGSAGVAAFKKGWIPFVANLASAEYFAGITGFYPVAPLKKGKIQASAHQLHFFNYAGCVACMEADGIRVHRGDLLDQALKLSPAKQGTQSVVLGFADMKLGDGATTHVQSKAAWDYSCDNHREWKGTPFELENVGERGSSVDPIVTKHKKEIVIKAYSVPRTVKGEQMFVWRSVCTKCRKVYYVDPQVMLEKCLVEPKKAELPPVQYEVLEEDAPPEEEPEPEDDRGPEKSKAPVLDEDADAEEEEMEEEGDGRTDDDAAENEEENAEEDDKGKEKSKVPKLDVLIKHDEKVPALNIESVHIQLREELSGQFRNSQFSYHHTRAKNGLYYRKGQPIPSELPADELNLAGETKFSSDPFVAWQPVNQFTLVNGGRAIVVTKCAVLEDVQKVHLSFGGAHVMVPQNGVFRFLSMLYANLKKLD